MLEKSAVAGFIFFRARNDYIRAVAVVGFALDRFYDHIAAICGARRPKTGGKRDIDISVTIADLLKQSANTVASRRPHTELYVDGSALIRARHLLRHSPAGVVGPSA